MTRFLVAVGAVAVLAGTATGLAGGTPGLPDATGVIGVLRRDGLVLPFARFKGDDWKTKWPGSTRLETLPLSLAAVPDDWWAGPPPADWRAWFADGSSQPIAVDKPATYRSGCDIRIGLHSDYASREPVPGAPTEPFPKDGLAISDGMPFAPIERVDPATNRGPRLLEVLGPELNRTEDSQLRRIRSATGWRHPVDDRDRHETPARIEAWYRAPGERPGATVSYVEVVRSYEPGPEDEGCGLDTYFSGWVFEDPSRRDGIRIRIAAHATYCDREGTLYMLPFGRMLTGGKMFWIYQLSGWDEEWYVVTRVERDRATPVIEYFGGGASSCGLRRR
jgi:hypothetical protein